MSKIINELAIKVRDAILNDDAIDPELKIDVLEMGGVITLTGRVPSEKDAAKAESIAKKQEGVITVINELSVEKPDPDQEATAPPVTPRN